MGQGLNVINCQVGSEDEGVFEDEVGCFARPMCILEVCFANWGKSYMIAAW